MFEASWLHSWGRWRYASTEFFVENLILSNFYSKHFLYNQYFLQHSALKWSTIPFQYIMRNIFPEKFEKYLKEISSKISLKLFQNLAQAIPMPVIEIVWHYTYSYTFCAAVFVETVGKIFGKFKSMFLEVFFRFLGNFGDNFVKNLRKFQSSWEKLQGK